MSTDRTSVDLQLLRPGRSAGRLALLALLLSLLLVLAAVWPGSAQDEALKLTVHRDFGYSLGSQMQGRFTFTVTGGPQLASAALLIDGKEVATDDQAPFNFTINTSDYGLGNHVISATGRTADGRTLRSNDLTVEFVESGRAMQSLLPIIGAIVIIAVLVSVLTAWLSSRKAPSTSHYGVAGGAICKACSRPFPLAVMQANLPGGKLARCPYCGKWQIARRARPEALAAAEAAQTQATSEVPELSPEEQLRRQIEESRYGG